MSDDVSVEFLQALYKFESAVPEILKGIVQEGSRQLYGLITGEFLDGSTGEPPSHGAFPANPSHLAIGGGALAKSFQVGNSENVFKIESTPSKVTGEYGSMIEYAAINEYGGLIPTTEKSKKFFMAMWLTSGGGSVEGKLVGDMMWFSLYVKAARHQSIVVKARPYFIPAIDLFEEHFAEYVESTKDAALESVFATI